MKELTDHLSDHEVQRLAWAYQGLTAELLRKMGGGGDTKRIAEAVKHAAKLTEAIEGIYVSQLDRCLEPLGSWEQPIRPDDTPYRSAMSTATNTICEGVLLLLASRMDGHAASEARGMELIQDGVRTYNEAKLER